MAVTTKTPVFISFDYDHDEDLRVLLSDKRSNHDTPFSFEDWSIKHETKAGRLTPESASKIGLVIVICGHHTQQAIGVSEEIAIARDEGVPYHLLHGRKNGWVRRPQVPRGSGTNFTPGHGTTSVMCIAKPQSWWKTIW